MRLRRKQNNHFRVCPLGYATLHTDALQVEEFSAKGTDPSPSQSLSFSPSLFVFSLATSLSLWEGWG